MQRLRRVPDVRPSAAFAVVRLGPESRREWGVHQLLVSAAMAVNGPPEIPLLPDAEPEPLRPPWRPKPPELDPAHDPEPVTLENELYTSPDATGDSTR